MTGLRWSDILAMASTLPGTEASTSYGTAAIKVKGKLIARLREDGETMVLGAPLVVRDHLVAQSPKMFFLEEHYRDYPWVLVRLTAARMPVIRELLEDAWRNAAPPRLRSQREAKTPPSRARAQVPPSGRGRRGA